MKESSPAALILKDWDIEHATFQKTHKVVRRYHMVGGLGACGVLITQGHETLMMDQAECTRYRVGT